MIMKASPSHMILGALQAVQQSVREDIQARIAAGEDIAHSDGVPAPLPRKKATVKFFNPMKGFGFTTAIDEKPNDPATSARSGPAQKARTGKLPKENLAQ